jgi:UDP-glucose 4-epimerase
MILITGGLGFIGSHTARALLDHGESCVLVQRRMAALPSAWADDVGERAVIEQVDITDREKFLEIGRRHRITGIVHLAGSMPWPPGSGDPVDSARSAVDSLLNVVQAAREWDVTRVSVASTIGVYGGVDAPNPLREDLPLSMTAGHVIPAFKKVGELLTDHLTDATGISIVNVRLAAIWGPLGILSGSPTHPCRRSRRPARFVDRDRTGSYGQRHRYVLREGLRGGYRPAPTRGETEPSHVQHRLRTRYDGR